VTEVEDEVRFFDTTLRDGEQSPGAAMTAGEKVEVARALARLGVDVIEAGFAAASPDDFSAVSRVAREVGRAPGAPTICSLARATPADIDQALRAIEGAGRGRVHTFLATSPIHRERKLRMSRTAVLDRVGEMVRYAAARCEDVELSAEDAGRTEPDFLHEVVRVAIQAGARTVNIPDTVGYTQPQEFGALVAGIIQEVPEARGIVISVHCHDDLGLAVANSLAGLRAGARQVEVAVNGIGERAGNTALEEVVMALDTRRDLYGLGHRLDTRQLWPTSKLVSQVTGMEVQPNKAVVGRNAFAHEAGIHQDGMLKHHETYEIMRPEAVGAPRTALVLGKHSGRRALGARLSELGAAVEGAVLDQVFDRFKILADRRKQVTDADLLALVRDEVEQQVETHRLAWLEVTSRPGGVSATVALAGPEGERAATATGAGPVDAVFHAVDAILGTDAELADFQIEATGGGSDALGEASVRVRTPDGRSHRGLGSHQDVLEASAKAYVAAQNKALASRVGSGGAASEVCS
jgi:2-isopropylmalate synthase